MKSSSSSTTQGPSPRNVVDLTMESPSPAAAAAATILVDDDDNDEVYVLLDSLSHRDSRFCKIVGIQYYTGKAHPGEYVTLQREPQNPYDRNAIRVDNMHGRKVGHIKRELAAVLSPLMDRYGNNSSSSSSSSAAAAAPPLLTIDASIPSPGSKWDMPLQMEFRGRSSASSSSSSSAAVAADLQALTQLLQHALTRVRDNRSRPVVAASSSASSSVRAAAAPQVHIQKLDWKQQQKHLDDMFAEQTAKQLTNLPEIKLPSSLLQATLLPHQMQAVQWLYQRERGGSSSNNNNNNNNNKNMPPFYKQVQEQGRTMWLCEITQATQVEPPRVVKGGILADDMGLGKTISSLALILANPPPGRDYTKPLVAVAAAAAAQSQETNSTTSCSSNNNNSSAPSSNQDKRLKKPTKTAIKKLKLPLLQNILMQAGLPTATKKDQLVSAVLDALDHGKLTWEQYYTYAAAVAKSSPVAATATTTAATATTKQQYPQTSNRTTLIVAPVSVMSNWSEQIDQHIAPNTLRVALYHGNDRHEVLDSLDQVDVLIASYNTLQYDYTSQVGSGNNNNNNNNSTTNPPPAKKFKANSIFTKQFHRIILDEAHTVRNAQSRTFQACLALQAEYRLCLTGTPIQNRPNDIESLLQFLRMPPFADNKTVFRRAIAQPIKEGGTNGCDEGLSKLRVLLSHVALRRNKSMVPLRLPNKMVELRAVVFGGSASDDDDGGDGDGDDNSQANPNNGHGRVYQIIFESAKRVFQATLRTESDQALAKQGSSIFEILTRLRQACCSGKLVPVERLKRAEEVLASLEEKKDEDLSAEEANQLLEKLKGALQDHEEDTPPECAVCFESMNESAAVILRGCGHVFCQVCLSRVSVGHHSNCPFCRRAFKPDEMIQWSSAAAAAAQKADENESSQKQVALSEQLDTLGPSPKLEALLLAVQEMKEGEKGVIFSQFTKFLDEIQYFLKEKGYTFARIDGSKTATQRIDAMQRFNQEESGPQFMLCSLHAAGTGINLTRASHTFMMDTWWNKAVEQQAMDRVHRIGQRRDVRVVRFVAADSIESRMVELQEAKAAVGKGAFENLSSEEKRRARLGDLKKLLDLS